MKTYDVLYAEDVPHYGNVLIEAECDDEAVRIAKEFNHDEVVSEPEWSNAVSKRVVSIQNSNGDTIAEDISLDDTFLRTGGKADRLRCDAAEDLFQSLSDILAHLDDLSRDFSICEEVIESSYGKAAYRALRKAEGRAGQ